MSYTVAGTIENVSYVWTSRGEQTGTFHIDETEGDHKIVAYTKKDGIVSDAPFGCGPLTLIFSCSTSAQVRLYSR